MIRRRPVRPGGDGAAGPAHLQRSTAWAGLHRGDPVAVAAGSRLRTARWAFVGHVRNTVSGAEWVEVVGGRPGERAVRCFQPEQVFPATSPKKGTRAVASLAEAPQLPLG